MPVRKEIDFVSLRHRPLVWPTHLESSAHAVIAFPQLLQVVLGELAPQSFPLTLTLSHFPFIHGFPLRLLLLSDLRPDLLGLGLEYFDSLFLFGRQARRQEFAAGDNLLRRREVLLRGVEALSPRIRRARAVIASEGERPIAAAAETASEASIITSASAVVATASGILALAGPIIPAAETTTSRSGGWTVWLMITR